MFILFLSNYIQTEYECVKSYESEMAILLTSEFLDCTPKPMNNITIYCHYTASDRSAVNNMHEIEQKTMTILLKELLDPRPAFKS